MSDRFIDNRPAGPTRPQALLILLVLTGFAATARLIGLGHATLWGDEALVFARTQGTWADLWAWLRDDDFTPLHYVTVWLLGQETRLTPTVLRLPSAVLGTLIVPAAYWLGRELRDRRLGLITAALAAGSAFLIFHGRDAKMYAPAWTFATAFIAAGLAFANRGGAGRWLACVGLGLLMVGWHASTLAVLVIGVGAAMLPLRPRRLAAITLAAATVVAAWLAYVTLVQQGPPSAAPDWVADYNAKRTALNRVGYLLSAWLTGWELPRPADVQRLAGPAASGLEVALFRGGLAASLVALPLIALTWSRLRGEPSPPGAFDQPAAPARPKLRPYGWTLVIGWLLLGIAIGTVSLLGLGRDVWLPRYLGVSMPALLVLTAMAFDRLPGKVAIIGVLVWATVNVVSVAARLTTPSEPPAGRYMSDVVAAMDDSSLVTILHARPQPVGEGPVGPGAPGTAYPGGFVSAYYGALHAGLDRGEDQLPAAAWTSPMAVNFRLLGQSRVWDDTTPKQLADLAATRAANANRLIVWSGHDDAGTDLILGRLRAEDTGWRRVDDETFEVREPWTYQQYQPMRRRVFER